MKQGRELDAEICEVIFGWSECFKVPPDADGENGGFILAPNPSFQWEDIQLPAKGKIGRAFFCPLYSSNMRLALSLAKVVGLTIAAKDLPDTAEGVARLCLDFFREKTRG